jgi:hypothetical protein
MYIWIYICPMPALQPFSHIYIVSIINVILNTTSGSSLCESDGSYLVEQDKDRVSVRGTQSVSSCRASCTRIRYSSHWCILRR